MNSFRRFRRQLISHQLIWMAVLMLGLQSCALRGGLPPGSDPQIEQIAKTLDITVNTLTVFQKAVISSNAVTPKLIPDATADQLARFALEANRAAKEAIIATRAVAKLSPADRADITQIMAPILIATDNTLKSPGLASIQSEQLRLILQASLTSIQTTVASVQLVLSTGR
jgi:hypothetical protein